MKTSMELIDQRNAIVIQARKTYEEAEDRSGGATAEDEAAFDRAMNDVDALEIKFEKLKKLENHEERLHTPNGRQTMPLDLVVKDRQILDDEARSRFDIERKRLAFRVWLREGSLHSALHEENRGYAELMSTLAPEKRALHALDEASGETRDLSIAPPGTAGYLITPVQITDYIINQMDNLVYIRELCRRSNMVTTITSAQKLGVRQRLTRMAPAVWTGEIAPTTPDTALTFGRRDLEPNQLTAQVNISNRTLMLSRDVEREVLEDMAYQFAIAQEIGYMTGTGTGQPLGCFTASANGIPTTQDVPAASSTVIAGDDLINVKFSLRQVYLTGPSVAWLVHRNIVKAIRKIKFSSATGVAGDQQYIWTPGLTEGAPDRILDIPYKLSEYAPSSIATGLYTAILGNFAYFQIAELPTIAIQRLVELYAANGEVGFIGRSWVDGSPVLGEAFARLKMA